ncbi:MAG TPA: SDR family oxidoreductase [Candidatus Lokiarchaeia archaeon]|nr:SDR family oxidoreductase [Candidatus Lokiarchaeia archaeon]
MVNPKLIQQQPFSGKIIIITGGSKGIGRATAVEIAKLGGSVCVVARTPEPLAEAVEAVKTNFSQEGQFVESIAADTTNMALLQPLLETFVQEHGVPDYLIQCVGYAYPQYVEKLTLDDFRRNMEVNYFGQVVPILCLLPHFMAAKKGHIANVSSALGFMGLMGYATYVPSKFAIVGLTETLRHELKPYGLTFSILYPPDTDTPGFAIENQSKPPETAIVSKKGKLLQPEQVAEVFIAGILKKEFYILPGESKFIWKMFRHFPGLVHSVIDGDLKKARKQVGRT